MSAPLPPPVPGADAPPPPYSPSAIRHEHVRPGDLTPAWRWILGLGWAAAFFVYAAVWQASVQLGIATWWVGPRAQPAPTALRLLPFVVTVTMCVLVIYAVRRLAQISLLVAVASAIVALPDFSRSVGLAVTELIISTALVVVSVSSLAGRFRVVEVDRPAVDGGASAFAHGPADRPR